MRRSDRSRRSCFKRLKEPGDEGLHLFGGSIGSQVRQPMEIDGNLIEAELFVVAGQSHALLDPGTMGGEIELW